MRYLTGSAPEGVQEAGPFVGVEGEVAVFAVLGVADQDSLSFGDLDTVTTVGAVAALVPLHGPPLGGSGISVGAEIPVRVSAEQCLTDQYATGVGTPKLSGLYSETEGFPLGSVVGDLRCLVVV